MNRLGEGKESCVIQQVGKVLEVKERASVYHKSHDCARDLCKGCLKMYQLSSIRLQTDIYFQTAELTGDLAAIPDACYQPSADGTCTPCSAIRKGEPRSSYMSGEAFQMVLNADKGGVS